MKIDPDLIEIKYWSSKILFELDKLTLNNKDFIVSANYNLNFSLKRIAKETEKLIRINEYLRNELKQAILNQNGKINKKTKKYINWQEKTEIISLKNQINDLEKKIQQQENDYNLQLLEKENKILKYQLFSQDKHKKNKLTKRSRLFDW